jgi:hypothetical protein
MSHTDTPEDGDGEGGADTHRYFFRARIAPEDIDDRVRARGASSRAEYFRILIREDMTGGADDAP